MKSVELTPEESNKPLEEDLNLGEKTGDEIKIEKENHTGKLQSIVSTELYEIFHTINLRGPFVTYILEGPKPPPNPYVAPP